jgi:hypothetical protein
MLDALCERLLEKHGLYRDEMAVFLYDEFGILVTVSSISRALAYIRWSKKANDESGCDKRIGFRRTG